MRRRARGYVLVVALFVLVVVMTGSLLAAVSLHQRMGLLRQERQNVELTAMLDGALAKGLARLWGDPDFEGATEPFGNGSIEIETRKVTGLLVEVTVRASLRAGGRAARARVRIDRRPPDEREPPEVLVWEPLPYR